MTHPMVEKCARALAVQAGCNPDDPAFVRYPSGEAFGICWRDKFVEPARAALTALLEPDEQMVEAMVGEIRFDVESDGLPEQQAAEAFTAAIRSLLEEK
jgi:hypothetical protein